MRNLRSRVTIVPYLCLLCPGTTHDIMQDADPECRMQNQPQAQSCELHPTDKLFGSDFASCILHSASCTMQKNPFWGRFCILHPAFSERCTYRVNILGLVLHSAFCICILHFQEKYGN